MQPFVSIIVTSYNHAEYLEQRMESLIHQDYNNREIIVIDDGSTDDSRQVLEKYKAYPNIHLVFLEKNTGYAHACNLGLKMSQGDYVMFAECDDFNEASHLSVLVTLLDCRPDVGVAYCQSHIVNEQGQIIGNDFHNRDDAFKTLCRQDTAIPKETMSRFLLYACVIPNMSAALIRKGCIDRVGGLSTQYRVCADWDFWCKMAEHCSFYYIIAPLNYFRTHSTTVRSTAGISLHVIEYYKLLYNAFSKINMSFYEGFRFRVHCGIKWVNFIAVNPCEWLRNFPSLCRETMKYEKFSIVFLALGIFANALRLLRKLMKT
jgi:glycosyltransferase involved in cell wall biosynthesis